MEFSQTFDLQLGFPLGVFRTSDGEREVDLASNAPAGSSWQALQFLEDGQTLLGLLERSAPASATLMAIQLSTGKASPKLTFDGFVNFAGVSAGCPVVSSITWDEGAWRACGACDGPAFATGTVGGVVSRDGTVYLSQQDSSAFRGTFAVAGPALARADPAVSDPPGRRPLGRRRISRRRIRLGRYRHYWHPIFRPLHGRTRIHRSHS